MPSYLGPQGNALHKSDIYGRISMKEKSYGGPGILLKVVIGHAVRISGWQERTQKRPCKAIGTLRHLWGVSSSLILPIDLGLTKMLTLLFVAMYLDTMNPA